MRTRCKEYSRLQVHAGQRKTLQQPQHTDCGQSLSSAPETLGQRALPSASDQPSEESVHGQRCSSAQPSSKRLRQCDQTDAAAQAEHVLLKNVEAFVAAAAAAAPVNDVRQPSTGGPAPPASSTTVTDRLTALDELEGELCSRVFQRGSPEGLSSNKQAATTNGCGCAPAGAIAELLGAVCPASDGGTTRQGHHIRQLNRDLVLNLARRAVACGDQPLGIGALAACVEYERQVLLLQQPAQCDSSVTAAEPLAPGLVPGLTEEVRTPQRPQYDGLIFPTPGLLPDALRSHLDTPVAAGTSIDTGCQQAQFSRGSNGGERVAGQQRGAVPPLNPAVQPQAADVRRRYDRQQRFAEMLYGVSHGPFSVRTMARGEGAQASEGWAVLPAEIIAEVYRHVTPADIKAGRLVCGAWRKGCGLVVQRLRLDSSLYSRTRGLVGLFPCLKELDLLEVGSIRSNFGWRVNFDALKSLSHITTVRLQVDCDPEHYSAGELARRLAVCSTLTSLGLKVQNLDDDDDLATLVSTFAPTLTELDLSYSFNMLSGAGLKALAVLSQLRHLDIGRLPVCDTSAATIASLTQLTSLGLSGREMGDVGVARIGSLTGLQRLALNLNWGRVTDGGLAALSSLTNLTDLTLALRHGISDASLTAVLAGLSQLCSLKITDGYFAGARALASIQHMRCLHTLIVDCKQTDQSLAVLKELPCLTSLGLLSRDMTPATAQRLGECTRLQDLAIPCATDSVVAVLDSLVALHTLKLTGSAAFTGMTFPALPSLRKLSLKHCDNLVDAGMSRIAAGAPELQNLKLGSKTVTDVGLLHLSSLTALRSLTLSSCKGLVGDGLKRLIGTLLQLQEFSEVGLRNKVALAAKEAKRVHPILGKEVKRCW